MRKRIRTRPGLFLVLGLLVAVVAASALPSFVSKASAKGAPPATIDQLYNVIAPEMSADNAFAYSAYVFRGWRNAGGPWFNQVMSWIADQMAADGFANGHGAPGAHYWTQMDYRSGSIWVPQYLSMQIVGPEGDADPANPGAYHFDHPAVSTFDPTSIYYPAYMDLPWVLSHVGTPEEAAIQDRCHLATSSNFTAPIDTPLDVASTPEGGAITADIVDVGTVSSSGTRTWSKHSTTPLAGKILFSSSASISTLMTLAQQQLAKAVMSSSGLSAYSDPTIGGVELYPNNVRFASGGSATAPVRVTLNISKDDVRFLTALCAQYDLTSSFPQMKLFAIGGYTPYSVSPDTSHQLPTVIAEIPGTDPNPVIANQRVVYAAHVQEPGMNDNATGVGTLLEMVRTVKHLIDTGQLAPPRRTLTFIWGLENSMGSLWKAQNPADFESTQMAIDLDMTGEDPVKCGGPMRIEKYPDPSTQYSYQLDRLPDDPAPVLTKFLRSPDSHTLWGGGGAQFWPYPGHFINDYYMAASMKVKSGSPDFNVVVNPYEGGSDHTTFLGNKDASGNWDIKPAVLTWHFTDYTYHSSMDTPERANGREMRDVAVTSAISGYDVANATVASADETLTVLTAASHARFGLEKANSANHYLWALTHAYGTPATIDNALHEARDSTVYYNSSTRSGGETKVLGDWGYWYQQAVTSAATIFDPASRTPEYTANETAASAAVTADMNDALANSAHLFAVSHFTNTGVAINGGDAWAHSHDVTLNLTANSYAAGGVTGVRFSEDGVTWPGSFQAFSASVPFTLGPFDGVHNVYAQFQDSEGNIADAVSDSINLDATPPEITVNSPTQDGFYVSGLWALDFSKGDVGSGLDVTREAIKLDGDPATAADVANAVGSHTVSITEFDLAGGSTTVSRDFGAFATPELLYGAPNSASLTQGDSTSVSWSLNGAVSVGSFRVWLKNTATNAWVRVTPTSPAIAPLANQTAYSVPWNVTQPSGTYKLWVYYYAADGTTVRATTHSAGSITIGLKPTPTVVSPNSGSFLRGTSHVVSWSMSSAASTGSFRVWLKNTATNAWVRITPSSAPVAAIAGHTSYSVAWFATQPAGTYKLWIYYYSDAAGSVVSSTAASSGTITLL